MTGQEEFRLSFELHGHSKDIRCITETVVPPLGLCSGSRDLSAIVWSTTEGFPKEEFALSGHEGFVMSVCTIPPSAMYPTGLVATGCQDKRIRLFSTEPPQLLQTLKGHTEAVCSLTYEQQTQRLVSSSWDKTARVWSLQDIASVKCVTTLAGHEQAVWAVAAYCNEQGPVVEPVDERAVPHVLTASADKLIMLWVNGMQAKTFLGHDDCVRGLALFDHHRQFLSCANDSSIRRWCLTTGHCLQTLYGHDEYIYSITLFPDQCHFATGGEDGCVRLWSCNPDDPTVIATQAQSITQPALSVWAVTAMSNGDLAVGASDGVVRVFSADPARQATADLAAVFEESVRAFYSTKDGGKEINGVKISDLPGPEALKEPGTKDGQTKMVRSGTKVEVHEWTNGAWAKIGDVVDPNAEAQSGSNSQMDVGFSDPLTGGSRYVPGGGSVSTQGAAAPADPFTGGNRYMPNPVAAGSALDSAPADPYTGSGRYIPNSGSGFGDTAVSGSSSDPLRPRSDHIPAKDNMSFTAVNVKTMEKLIEHNASPACSHLQLNEAQLSALRSASHVDERMSAEDLQAANEALALALRWPIDLLTPVLDVLHTCILRFDTCDYFCGQERAPQTMQLLVETLRPELGTPPTPAQVICVCRVLGNMFSWAAGLSAIAPIWETLMPVVMECGLSIRDRPAAHRAAVAFPVNMARLLLEAEDDRQRGAFVGVWESSLSRLLDAGHGWNDETILNLITACGTALYGCYPAVEYASRNTKAIDVVRKLKDLATDERTKHEARLVEAML